MVGARATRGGPRQMLSGRASGLGRAERLAHTRHQGDQNFRLIKRAVKLIPNAKTDAIWPALKAIGKERNLIGHGVWMWTNEDRPLVVWHSKFLEDVDWVGAEFFDFTRFDFLCNAPSC